ncbi:methyltransferase [Legionella moravica]|uniref:Histone-lysine N-methyltransferase, H3 lysine-79 specific n=2 Tax=Legionella moravica TaxID=39962 RepID=A0A378K3K0_9GAMM|nr:methyltransferase [Legionella moravica]STX64148.1 putative methyltransferases [Legionella moravica]
MMMAYGMVDTIFNFMHLTATLLFLVIMFLLLFNYVPKMLRRFKIQRWQHSLNLPKHAQVFKQLYTEVDGFSLSRLARHNQKEDAIEYTYGEIEFLPFIALLSLVSPDCDTVFYDLGCGVGKAVIACGMVYPVRKSIGVEILPELYSSACAQIQKLAANPDYRTQTQCIQFINSDLLDVDLNEATLVFINSTTFFGTTWERVNSMLSHLPQIHTVITTSKPLLNREFTMITRTKLQMSWGIVPAFIHIRKLI